MPGTGGVGCPRRLWRSLPIPLTAPILAAVVSPKVNFYPNYRRPKTARRRRNDDSTLSSTALDGAHSCRWPPDNFRKRANRYQARPRSAREQHASSGGGEVEGTRRVPHRRQDQGADLSGEHARQRCPDGRAASGWRDRSRLFADRLGCAVGPKRSGPRLAVPVPQSGCGLCGA